MFPGFRFTSSGLLSDGGENLLGIHERFAAFLRVPDLRRAPAPCALPFLAAEPDFFAGVRLLSLMLFCSSDMKSTTLVDASFGIDLFGRRCANAALGLDARLDHLGQALAE